MITVDKTMHYSNVKQGAVLSNVVAKKKLIIRNIVCKSYACPTPVVRTSQVSWRPWKLSLKDDRGSFTF